MRSRNELWSIVEGYAASGMTRREYCGRHGISMSTLDYWRRKRQRRPNLVEVAIETQPTAGFALVLRSGRRIESSWRFAEADLLRLIRAAEG